MVCAHLVANGLMWASSMFAAIAHRSFVSICKIDLKSGDKISGYTHGYNAEFFYLGIVELRERNCIYSPKST